jgi:hypothetical protein
MLVAVTACYSDSSAPPTDTLHGRYVLRTLDDRPLPAVFSEQTNLKVVFLSGVITLQPDLSFTDSTEIRRTEGQLVRRIVDVAEGSYSRNANSINLRSTRGENYTLAFSGQTLTQNLAGVVLIYRR